MATVKFYEYTEQVKARLDHFAMTTIEECAGELEAQTKRNTAVDTGQTKNSWQHRVSKSGDMYTGTIGSDYMNAIWEEFGTGEYALHGDGRQGGWKYKDASGNWHFTLGKKPRRPFQRAYDGLKNKLIRHMQKAFKGALS